MEKTTKVYKWSRGKVQAALNIDFFRFCVVGAIGFVINFVFLTLTHGVLKIPIIPAQIISGEFGLISNFFFHNYWTYKHHDHQGQTFWQKFGKFHASSWTGIVILTAITYVNTEQLKIHYMIGLAIAAAITMMWNFFWTKFFIFKGQTPAVLMHPEDAAELTDN